jgi:DNA-binding protein HU-beta
MQKAAPAKTETVTLRHLAADPAESRGLPKAKTNDMLTGMVDAITGHLRTGRRIRVSGLGILQVRKRPAHGSRSRNRRSHQDQGRQEGRVPCRKGTYYLVRNLPYTWRASCATL